MSHAGRRRLAGTTGLVLLLSLLGTVNANAAACGPTNTTWTGAGDGTSWTDAANWDNGVPGATTPTIIAGPVSITGVAGTVCDLTLSGPASGQIEALQGNLSVVGNASLSGFLSWNGTLASEQALDLQAHSDLALADGSVVTLDAQATFEAGALLHGPATPTTAPVLQIPGQLTLTGPATTNGVGVQLLPNANGSGSMELNGNTLTVQGPGTSLLREAATVTSSTSGGALVMGSGATLVVTTGSVIQAPASLRILAGATFGGGSNPVTLGGTGLLDWRGGSSQGAVTLAMPTLMQGGGNRLVPAGSSLTNVNQATVADGTLDLEGAYDNAGSLALSPGATVRSAAAVPLTNEAGSTLSISSTTNGGSAVLDGVALVNHGIVSLPSKSRLVLGSSGTPVTSDLADGGSISYPSAPASTTDPLGMLQVTQGSTLRLSGTTTLSLAGVLLEDPLGDGSTARLVGATTPALLTTPTAGGGTFTWRSGTLDGSITLDKLTTDISAGNAASHRVLAGQLILGGTATLNPTVVELAPQAVFRVTGALTMASAPGGFDVTGGQDGQQVQVATGGSLRHIAQSTTATGSSNSTGAMTIAVPFVNNGTVSLETSLTVPAGYTQDIGAGAPATADAPVTGLFGTAVLSSVSGDGAGPITLTAGGLGGTGTVQANPLTLGSGFLHPGTASTSGTLTLQGPVVLGGGTDLQIVLRSATDHDKLVVAPLTAGATTIPGSLALNGKLSGLSSGYDPAYGSVVAGVITFPTKTGVFATGASSGTSNGLGWRPQYPASGTAVDLSIVDVAPPALGIAGNPSFTQLTAQRFTYAAVDNKTGVDSFDVRWYRTTSTSAIGGWNYPATWQRSHLTSQTLSGLADGYTYCFSVRVRDKAANLSAWSQPLCTSKLLDDRAMSASTGWLRRGGLAAYYHGTYSRTTTAGAVLRRTGTFTRVAFTAVKCRGCGNVLVYSGATRIGSLSLNSTTTALTSWVSPVLTSRTAVVTLKVSSGGHPVSIDAFGLAR